MFSNIDSQTYSLSGVVKQIKQAIGACQTKQTRVALLAYTACYLCDPVPYRSGDHIIVDVKSNKIPNLS